MIICIFITSVSTACSGPQECVCVCMCVHAHMCVCVFKQLVLQFCNGNQVCYKMLFSTGHFY